MRAELKIDITNKKYRNILLLSYSVIAAMAVAVVVIGVVGLFSLHTRKTIYHMAIMQLNNLDNVIDSYIDTWRKQLQTAWDETTIKQYVNTTDDHWKEEYESGHYLYRMSINNGMENYVCLFRNDADFKYYGWYYPGLEARKQIEEKIMETENDMQMLFVEADDKRNLCVFLTERDSLGGRPRKGVIYSVDLDSLERQLLGQSLEDSMFLAFGKDGSIILRGGVKYPVNSANKYGTT